jgi:hypothetical protein
MGSIRDRDGTMKPLESIVPSRPLAVALGMFYGARAGTGHTAWAPASAQDRGMTDTCDAFSIKVDHVARKVADGAQQLATFAGLTQLLLVVGVMRAQAWMGCQFQRRVADDDFDAGHRVLN